MHAILRVVLDGGALDEFQEHRAQEIICGDARDRGHDRRGDRQSARPDQGAAGEKPRFGGIIYPESAEKVAFLHRSLRPARDPAAVRAGCLRVHGRTGGRAGRNHPRGRALGRSDGDRASAQDRSHRQSRLGRRLLRDGGPGFRSRFHFHLAHRPHGRHGGRVRRSGGARAGDRGSTRGQTAGAAPRSPRPSRPCGRNTKRNSTPAMPRRGDLSTRSSIPKRRASVLAMALRTAAHNPGPASRARSCSPVPTDEGARSPGRDAGT